MKRLLAIPFVPCVLIYGFNAYQVAFTSAVLTRMEIGLGEFGAMMWFLYMTVMLFQTDQRLRATMNIKDFDTVRELIRDRNYTKKVIEAISKTREFYIPFFSSDQEHRLSFGEHPAPSAIGTAFRDIKIIVLKLKESQLADIEARLVKLNMTTE